MQQDKFKLLAVDDRETILDSIRLTLGDQIEFMGACSAESALDILQANTFDIVITDYDLGSEVTGLRIFKEARRRNPFVTACLMSGNNSAPLMKEMLDTFGGIFIEKPFADDAFDHLLNQAKRNRQRHQEISKGTASQDLARGIVAETPSMIRLLNTIERVAPMASLSPHMTGPTGTGKSTLAELIHKMSGIKGHLITVNCAGLEELAMSRLFGHKKGAFTGAVNDHDGFISQANGGTLFLDELHLLPMEVQGKLLRVLQDGKYQRLGETFERESNFRLITAASVDVLKLASESKFLPDLWYRVAGKILTVPALSERKACIPRIVYHQLNLVSSETKKVYEIESDAMDLLVSFSWDGNIRDLTNSIRSMCSDTNSSGLITASMVREELSKRSGRFASDLMFKFNGETLEQACRGFEVSLISKTLYANQNNIVHTARVLGVPRTTLRRKMDNLGIKL